jgi:hypothetical protein
VGLTLITPDSEQESPDIRACKLLARRRQSAAKARKKSKPRRDRQEEIGKKRSHRYLVENLSNVTSGQLVRVPLHLAHPLGFYWLDRAVSRIIHCVRIKLVGAVEGMGGGGSGVWGMVLSVGKIYPLSNILTPTGQ